jgi:hypothetical protein
MLRPPVSQPFSNIRGFSARLCAGLPFVPKAFDGKVGRCSIQVTGAMPSLLNCATKHISQDAPGIVIPFYDRLAAR